MRIVENSYIMAVLLQKGQLKSYCREKRKALKQNILPYLQAITLKAGKQESFEVKCIISS